LQLFRHLVDSQCLASAPEELDSLAALLIQQLASSLDSKLISGYLSAMRQGYTDVFSSPISLEFPQSASLPSDFPESIQIPRFLYGDQVSLGSSNSECESGVVIGGVSFQSVNRWERGKTKPLPIVLKQIEVMVREMGESGSDLLAKYFMD